MSSVIVSGSRLPVRPSASEGATSIVTRRPAARLFVKGHDAATSTPMTRVAGDSAFMAIAMPLISPPPPIGTIDRVDDRQIFEQLERRSCRRRR